jgi:hypothetical protein
MGEPLLASMTRPLISPAVGCGVGVRVGTGVQVGMGFRVGVAVGLGVETVLQASVTNTKVAMVKMRGQCRCCFFAFTCFTLHERL